MTGRTADFVPVPRVERLRPLPPMPPPADLGTQWPLRSLHLNESPFAPGPTVLAAMQQAAAGSNRYPDHDGRELTAALSQRLDMAADRIVIGAGSNELLFASGEIALDPGNQGIAPDPGFITFARAIALRGGDYVGVPLRADGAIDVAAMLAAVTPGTRLVYIASPHSPTGSVLTENEIEHLVAELPDHVLLHYDEAYYEFGRHAGGPEALPLLSRRKGPWIATRTFSKAYSLAGARIGYGITSSTALADVYRKVRPTFSISAMALAGARAALEDTEYLSTLLDYTAQERARLADLLAQLGLRALPSAANFVMAIAPRPASGLAAALQKENILVLALPWHDTPGALRITIGTREDNDAAVAGLRRAMRTS
jgi:histidinol-phosphate aminotransferase